MTDRRVPFSARHRADLERWAAEGCKVARLMLDTGLPFADALAQLQAQLGRPIGQATLGPRPVHDIDEEEWR